MVWCSILLKNSVDQGCIRKFYAENFRARQRKNKTPATTTDDKRFYESITKNHTPYIPIESSLNTGFHDNMVVSP